MKTTETIRFNLTKQNCFSLLIEFFVKICIDNTVYKCFSTARLKNPFPLLLFQNFQIFFLLDFLHSKLQFTMKILIENMSICCDYVRLLLLYITCFVFYYTSQIKTMIAVSDITTNWEHRTKTHCQHMCIFTVCPLTLHPVCKLFQYHVINVLGQYIYDYITRVIRNVSFPSLFLTKITLQAWHREF